MLIAPSIDTLAAVTVDENEVSTLTGSYTDADTTDAHDVTVDWGDPNNGVDSVFAVSAINSLSVGNTFTSTSGDGAVLTITGLAGSTVSFNVPHQYLDDGLAPGNNTASDSGTISLTVADGTAQDVDSTSVQVDNVAPILGGTLPFGLDTKHLPSANTGDDDYGFSVAVDGDYAVVGAPKHNLGNPESGKWGGLRLRTR